jgi:membrane peptidoglycan carboxypeptidase
MSIAHSSSWMAVVRRLPRDPWAWRASGRPSVARWPTAWLRITLLLGVLVFIGYLEFRTSAIQSRLLSRYAANFSWEVQPGPSPNIAFPRGGPFDAERGYSRMGEFGRRLERAGYRIVEQARQSAMTTRSLRWGITPPYREPAVTGLVIHDSRGLPLYDARSRSVLFASFEDIPPLIVNTLLFMENRDLARPSGAERNPAIDWRRLAKAGSLYAARELGLPVRVEGGSTLAVQMEKYRHSEGGRTASPLDKLRQVTAASLRAYRNGPDSTGARREIVLDYLNSMPLAAAPGYGEVHGLGNGLQAWFDLELDAVREALAAPGASRAKAHAYKHVLALLYAIRAPTRYLLEDRLLLERRIVADAERLADAGVIDQGLHRALGEVPLRFRARAERPRVAFGERRATTAIRKDVRRLLGGPSVYELDRLHLEIESTLDGRLQRAATDLFRRLGDPDFVGAHGLRAERLLSSGDPRRVVYSLLLFERTPEGNLLRVHADNLDRPFDPNAGMKLDLGSTAKLRTLAHYLELVAALHGELTALDRAALDRRVEEARDPITRWAAETLREAPALGLDAFLERALERTYPADPGEVFFTGGGAHTFRNFDPDDDARVLSVRDALVRSTNLVFIRLMRDLVRFHTARLPYDAATLVGVPDHPARRRILEEMAEVESRQHLARAYRKYRGLDAAAAVTRLLRDRANSPRHLAIVFFAWHPGADAAALRRWLADHGHAATVEEAEALARAYGNPRLTLADHGYLLDRHPLEIWCAGEVSLRPTIAWDDLLARSAEPRRLASAWLFASRHRGPQDRRLRIRIEQDAFARMTPSWRRLGFPFERLVPSYATAIGASADRPIALAELMGIIVNDGVRRPTWIIHRLRFAPETPYHTVFERSRTAEERVLPAPVARALRRVLADAVEHGTARRVAGALQRPDGTPALVGGKTGSGDNRFETFAGPGRPVSSRAVSRTAAFVFYIDDRYFGVLTASVTGPAAEGYGFTSALPLAVLRLPVIPVCYLTTPSSFATEKSGRPPGAGASGSLSNRRTRARLAGWRPSRQRR